MKLLLVTTLLLIAVVSRAQKSLADIHTQQQLDSLLRAIKPTLGSLTIPDRLDFKRAVCADLAQAVHLQALQALDLTGDGRADLLLHVYLDKNGPVALVIPDQGPSLKPQILFLNHPILPSCGLALPGWIDSTRVLLLHRTKHWLHKGEQDRLMVDTLVWYDHAFVEYHVRPAVHRIEKIEYESSPCMGTCPYFRMTVHADRSALFNPVVDNRLPLGKYSCVIDSVHYTALTDLLNYIDFEKLQDRYNQPWTDDQTGTFIITYDYGKVKRIEDYAMQGTFGLRKLHEMMLALCDNQNWK